MADKSTFDDVLVTLQRDIAELAKQPITNQHDHRALNLLIEAYVELRAETRAER